MPVLAQSKTITGRLWTYVRDDRPSGGSERRRRRPSTHAIETASIRRHLASQAGILQPDACAGCDELHLPGRVPGAITEAACWAHGRRKFLVLADAAKAPIAIEAVRRTDLMVDIDGLEPGLRHAVGQERVVLVAEPET